MNVNFEPIIRGLKSDIFEVLNPFHICRNRLQKKKSGVKNVILNFHFDYLKPSLRLIIRGTVTKCENVDLF